MDAFERFGQELVKAGRRRRRARRRARRRGRSHGGFAWTGLVVIVAAAVSVAVALLASNAPDITATAAAARLLASTRASTARSPACRPPVPGRAVFVQVGRARPPTEALLGALRVPQTPRELELSRTLGDLRLAGPVAQLLGGSLRTLGTATGTSARVMILRKLPVGVTHSEPILCAHLELLEARRLGRRAPAAARARVRAILKRGLAEQRLLMTRPGGEEVYVAFAYRGHGSGAVRESVSRFAHRGAIIAHRLPTATGRRTRIEGIVPDTVRAAEVLPERGQSPPLRLLVRRNLLAATIPAAPGPGLVVGLLGGRGRELASERLPVR